MDSNYNKFNVTKLKKAKGAQCCNLILENLLHKEQEREQCDTGGQGRCDGGTNHHRTGSSQP